MVFGSPWNHSSNYLFQYTLTEWGGKEEKSSLVGGCLCFIDRSTYALIVYVDDMVVTGNDPDEKKDLQSYLSSEFGMKDLGHLKYFLGSTCLDLIKGFYYLKENML